MLRIEVPLKPFSEWNYRALEIWSSTIGGLIEKKGWVMRPAFYIPGYQIIEFGTQNGGDKKGEIIFSEAERAVILLGFSGDDERARDLLRAFVLLARDMGATSLFTYAEQKDWTFWESMGAKILPEITEFPGRVCPELIQVKPLHGLSLLVMYSGEASLCLELIRCNTHAPGVISLAQRRVEKKLGGTPLGFASRIAAHCPWEITREQWDDLLAYSRIMAFECINSLL